MQCSTYELWRLRGQPTGGKVFLFSEEAARKSLKGMAAAVTGYPQADFGLHSLRSGGATDMEDSGMSLSQIRHLGRWKSSAVLLYLRGGEIIAEQAGVRTPANLNQRTAL